MTAPSGATILRVPEPTHIDLAVRAVVARALAGYGPGVAEVEHGWGAHAGMWFTEVEPAPTGAAPLSLAFDGDDLLNVHFGATWFELFPFDDDALPYLESIVRAVLAGQVEESGTATRSFAHVHTAEGTVGVGHTHWPLPWRWRQVRRYEPYGTLLARPD